MKRLDFRDFFILAHVDAVLITATIYLFEHADPMVFGAWATFATTLVTCYHWFVVRDSKIPDAEYIQVGSPNTMYPGGDR